MTLTARRETVAIAIEWLKIPQSPTDTKLNYGHRKLNEWIKSNGKIHNKKLKS